MLVLIEGVDGSGKTTLTDALKSEYSCIYAKKGDIDVFLDDRVILSKEIYICDRSPLSDLVYRVFDGNQPKFDFGSMYRLLTKSKIIYCKTESSFEDSMRRGEDEVVNRESSNKISSIYDVVIKIIRMYSLSKVLDYDWTKDDIKKVKTFIKGEKYGVR